MRAIGATPARVALALCAISKIAVVKTRNALGNKQGARRHFQTFNAMRAGPQSLTVVSQQVRIGGGGGEEMP